MRRLGLLIACCGLCATAGVASAVLAAGSAPAAVLDTTTAASTTIAEGVTIGGVAVGGLTPDVAATTVQDSFARPITLLFARHRLLVTPDAVGAVAQVQQAVELALTATPGTAIPLQVSVRRERVRAFADVIANRFDRKPVDAQLFLRQMRPVIAPDRPGRALRREDATRTIVTALTTNRRGPFKLKARAIPARVTSKSFGPIIVIRRGSNRLYLYRGMRYWRTFAVATGQKAYPTPLGRFRIVVKWRNPWWYPPKSDWAKDEKPTPPGPNNPLGTRWMGLSAPGVGIHGTPNPGSIGYSVSHGCIRMRIPDAEWMFERVRIGTTVFIVAGS